MIDICYVEILLIFCDYIECFFLKSILVYIIIKSFFLKVKYGDVVVKEW